MPKLKNVTEQELIERKKKVQHECYLRYKEKYYGTRTSALITKEAHSALKAHCDKNNKQMFEYLSNLIIENCQ